MADTKISQLDELAIGNLASGDWFPIVDVSDTSMAATGTTKKIGANNFPSTETGTWTPVAAGVTLTTATGDYTRVGRIVVLSAELKWPATADTTTIGITGLPFASKNNFLNGAFVARSDYSTFNPRISIDINETVRIRKPDDSGGLTNADVSGKFFNLTFIYIMA